MGFLMNLPPPCNVILQPSTIGLSGKIPQSLFLVAFEKYLKGEVVPHKQEVVTEAPPPQVLPGKKAYIPPYTPKSSNRAHSSMSSISRGSHSRSGYSMGRSASASNSRGSTVPFARGPGGIKAKKPRMGEVPEEDRLATNVVLPKRETSRRKAKDNASRKYLNPEADEDDIPGLDLSDSDEDATWTPYKDGDIKNATPFGGNKIAADDLRALENDSEDAQTTRVLNEGQEFAIGDFMVLRSDLERESAPLWRLDSKTLLQRYNPVEGDRAGQCNHRSASLFSGFSAVNRSNYASVGVAFISIDQGETTVKVIQKPSRNHSAINQPDPTLRKRSLTETSQFQEPFEVYIQALISQSLDSNFLQEVFLDQDDYFVSNIEKVDSVTLLRKDKIMSGISWSRRFQLGIDTWPCINDLGSSSTQDVKCGACDSDSSASMVQMFGQPYNANTLKTVPPNEDASLNRNFSVCPRCCRLALLYHKLQHMKHRMFSMCNEVVESKKKSTPQVETTKILNELLANEQWLEEQFRKMQELWADADTFLR